MSVCSLKNYKIFALFSIVLLVATDSFGRSDTLRWKEGLKLQFGDCKISGIGTYVDVILEYSYNFEPGSLGRVTPIVFSEAIWNRETSSLPDSSLTNLRYAQLLFDIQGYGSRLLKLKASKLGELKRSSGDLKAKMDNIFFQVNIETSELRKALDMDLRSNPSEGTLMYWEERVVKLIRETPNLVVQTQVGNHLMGIFIGSGTNIFLGKTKDYFTNPIGLNFGFQFDYKKSRLALDLNLGYNKTLGYLESKGKWEQGTKSNFTNIELTYGVKLLKNHWLASPYIGFAVNEFTPRKSMNEDKRSAVGYSPVVGLEFNRSLQNKNSRNAESPVFYKLKISVNPSNLVKNFAGTQINLRLSVGLNVAAIVKKKLVESSSKI
jgi:hypothetical protein